MTRWEELISLLQAGDVTERQTATAVSLLLAKGRGAAANRETVTRLEEAIARWHVEDRKEED